MLDLLLPQRCLGCDRPGVPICSGCLERLPRLVAPLCECCGAPTVWPVKRCRECAGRRLAFATARAAVAYDPTVRRLVAGWKERGQRRLATLAAELVVEVVPRPHVHALTWIPADGDRSVRRGHHPAERLARELARRWELPAALLLARHGPAKRQRGLAVEERRRNVRGAFRPRGQAPGCVVLIDDVYTTGATVAAAATAFRAGGARRVEVVTFARAIRR
ncbi:MAG: ComF family protein [Gaiellaceae bacterium]